MLYSHTTLLKIWSWRAALQHCSPALVFPKWPLVQTNDGSWRKQKSKETVPKKNTLHLLARLLRKKKAHHSEGVFRVCVGRYVSTPMHTHPRLPFTSDMATLFFLVSFGNKNRNPRQGGWVAASLTSSPIAPWDSGVSTLMRLAW